MSDYGNVPETDVQVMYTAVKLAGRAAAHLPVTAPPEWRETAYEVVLDGILRDWVENGTNELDEEDEGDLGSLLRAAADVALSQEGPRREVTFRVLSRSALRDWVRNWNADEEDEDE